MSRNNFTTTVPAGSYWLGDPCYAVPDELWDELLDASDFFEHPSGKVAGHRVYASSTQWGDGQYRGTNGSYYPVDAGLIGLTPVELCEGEPFGCTKVTFDQPITFGYEDGTILVGDIRIYTGDDPDYEEEEEEEDYQYPVEDEEE